MQLKLYTLIFLILSSWMLIACKNNRDNEGTVPDSLAMIHAVDSSLNDSARLQMIEKMINANHLEAAINNINFLLDKSPDNPAFLFIKADALEKMKDTSEAIKYYLRADSAAGLFFQAKMKLLHLYAEKGNEKALLLSDSLYALPQAEKIHSDILLMKGICFTKRGQFQEAERVFDAILKDDYTCLQAYLEKGWIYYDRKQYQKALQIFELSTIVKNDFAEGYFWMAKTLQKLNRKDVAILNFKKSLLLDPALTESREELKSLGAIQ